MSLELIAAVAANGVIGRAGQLPWHLPDDLRHFKQLTMGHPIIMGRRTFESIGRALPGRRNIVVSRSAEIEGVETFRSLEEGIAATSDTPGAVFIIGGAQLYAAALIRADKMHLTELEQPVEGDVFFPTFDRTEWRLVNEREHEADKTHCMRFWFRTYERH